MRVLRILLSLAVFSIFAWGVVLLAIFLFGQRDEARPADSIVVLGAAQYDGRPSPVLKARLDHALQLYERGLAPVLILTGGVGVGDTVSEAEVGRRYAVRHGVPERAILVERAGLSTDESMSEVARIMATHRYHSAVLVSDRFHMLRLRILAARHGVRAYSSPTRTSPIALDSREEWRHVLRESMIFPLLLLGER